MTEVVEDRRVEAQGRGMTLPDVLRALSSALQSGGGRIRVQRRQAGYGHGPMETLYVVCGGHLSRIGIIAPDKHSELGPFALLHLEAALREECEARGWTWRAGYVEPGQCWGWVHRPGDRYGFMAQGPSPAEALARATLEALNAEAADA